MTDQMRKRAEIAVVACPQCGNDLEVTPGGLGLVECENCGGLYDQGLTEPSEILSSRKVAHQWVRVQVRDLKVGDIWRHADLPPSPFQVVDDPSGVFDQPLGNKITDIWHDEYDNQICLYSGPNGQTNMGCYSPETEVEVARQDPLPFAGSKTAVTTTEWNVSVTVPNLWLSTPGVFGDNPKVTLNVFKNLDEPNEWGGIGVSVKHPEYNGLEFDTQEEAWAFAESVGLRTARKTAVEITDYTDDEGGTTYHTPQGDWRLEYDTETAQRRKELVQSGEIEPWYPEFPNEAQWTQPHPYILRGPNGEEHSITGQGDGVVSPFWAAAESAVHIINQATKVTGIKVGAFDVTVETRADFEYLVEPEAQVCQYCGKVAEYRIRVGGDSQLTCRDHVGQAVHWLSRGKTGSKTAADSSHDVMKDPLYGFDYCLRCSASGSALDAPCPGTGGPIGATAADSPEVGDTVTYTHPDVPGTPKRGRITQSYVSNGTRMFSVTFDDGSRETMPALSMYLEKSAGIKGPLDPSVAHAILMDVMPGFGQQPIGNTTISDFLAAFYASDSTDMYAFAQEWVKTASRKTAGEEVEVTSLPICDMCQQNPAAYDTKTVMGPWANLCETCYPQYGVGQLGTGFGQRLILKSMKTAADDDILCEVCNLPASYNVHKRGSEDFDHEYVPAKTATKTVTKTAGFQSAIQRGVKLALDPQSGHGDSSLPTVEDDTPDDEPMWPWEIGEVVEEVVEELRERKGGLSVWAQNGKTVVTPSGAVGRQPEEEEKEWEEAANTEESMWPWEIDEDGNRKKKEAALIWTYDRGREGGEPNPVFTWEGPFAGAEVFQSEDGWRWEAWVDPDANLLGGDSSEGGTTYTPEAAKEQAEAWLSRTSSREGALPTNVYQIYHQECGQWHMVSPTPFTCPWTGETFEVTGKLVSKAVTVEIRDDSGAVQETLEITEEEAEDLQEQLPQDWELEIISEGSRHIAEDQQERQQRIIRERSSGYPGEVVCQNCGNRWYGSVNVECPNCHSQNVIHELPKEALTLDSDREPADPYAPNYEWELPEEGDPDLGQNAADVAAVPTPGDALDGYYPQPGSVNTEHDDEEEEHAREHLSAAEWQPGVLKVKRGHFLGDEFPAGTAVQWRVSTEDPTYVDVLLPDGVMFLEHADLIEGASVTGAKTAQEQRADGYGWLVTSEWVDQDANYKPVYGDVQVFGPRDISDQTRADLLAGKGSAFQLWDDDGVLMARGRFFEGDSEQTPLDDYGYGQFGATRMTIGNNQPYIGSHKTAQPESWSEIQYQEEHGYLPGQGMSAQDILEYVGDDPEAMEDFIDSMDPNLSDLDERELEGYEGPGGGGRAWPRGVDLIESNLHPVGAWYDDVKDKDDDEKDEDEKAEDSADEDSEESDDAESEESAPEEATEEESEDSADEDEESDDEESEPPSEVTEVEDSEESDDEEEAEDEADEEDEDEESKSKAALRRFRATVQANMKTAQDEDEMVPYIDLEDAKLDAAYDQGVEDVQNGWPPRYTPEGPGIFTSDYAEAYWRGYSGE